MSTYFTKSSIKKALGGVMLKILHFLCAFKKNNCKTPVDPLSCTYSRFLKQKWSLEELFHIKWWSSMHQECLKLQYYLFFIYLFFKAHAVNLWLLIFSYILLYLFPSFSYAVLKHFRSLMKALASNKIK